MSEHITEFFIERFSNVIPPEFIVFFISMLPIIELRGGIIASKLLGISFFKAFTICFVGNMLPIPFILKFIRYIFKLLKKNRKLAEVIEKLELKSMRKGEIIKKFREWGLLIIVAIPLPGTGAWTGALIADLLDIRIKKSLPIIAIGVFIAGLIISAISYGLFGIIGS